MITDCIITNPLFKINSSRKKLSSLFIHRIPDKFIRSFRQKQKCPTEFPIHQIKFLSIKQTKRTYRNPIRQAQMIHGLLLISEQENITLICLITSLKPFVNSIHFQISIFIHIFSASNAPKYAGGRCCS